MRERSIFAFAAVAFVAAVCGDAGRTEAAPPSRCKTYANDAVAHYKNMRNKAKCRVADNARWQPNYNNHYGWCLKAPAAWIDSEHGARVLHLSRCGGAGIIDD